jgi:CBS domain-containing protein
MVLQGEVSHMKVRELMTANPVCCLPTDTAQKVAAVLRDNDIGSVPVLENQDSHRLMGVITDRDLCCSVVANGLDPKNTPIEKFIVSIR